jgi:hypothetical protein
MVNWVLFLVSVAPLLRGKSSTATADKGSAVVSLSLELVSAASDFNQQRFTDEFAELININSTQVHLESYNLDSESLANDVITVLVEIRPNGDDVTQVLQQFLMSANTRELVFAGAVMPRHGARVEQWPLAGGNAEKRAPLLAPEPPTASGGLGVAVLVCIGAGSLLWVGFVAGSVALLHRLHEQRRIHHTDVKKFDGPVVP